MELRHVATRLIASHDTFRAAFADAATAAVHLALDPRNPDASAQRRSVQRFVTLSLAHMAEEESATFIQALTCGVAPATIDRFLDDHRDLRALARVLEVRLRSELCSATFSGSRSMCSARSGRSLMLGSVPGTRRDRQSRMVDEMEEPPISRSVLRALEQLTILRDELAESAECISAPALDEYRRLAPRLDHLERFEDASEPHVAELRELLIAASDLRDQIRRD
jgi:hypothetical protein